MSASSDGAATRQAHDHLVPRPLPAPRTPFEGACCGAVIRGARRRCYPGRPNHARTNTSFEYALRGAALARRSSREWFGVMLRAMSVGRKMPVGILLVRPLNDERQSDRR